MRSIFFFLLLIAASVANAQTNNKIKLDENTVVTDSAGTVYPYAIWAKLLATGEYSIKLNKNNTQNGFVLVRLTDEQIRKKEESAPKPKESAYFKTGSSFPNFKLKDIKGNTYNLKELKGKIVVLNFWFINCSPCRMEIPQLNKAVQEYRGDDVVFIAVALDEFAELENFLKTTFFSYNIIDDGRWFAQKNGVTSFPTHVVINKEGRIVYHTSGLSAGTVPWLKKTINEELKNKQEDAEKIN
ncbi:MAG: TlpA disulfide reductase family protein [Lacibacter sp.]